MNSLDGLRIRLQMGFDESREASRRGGLEKACVDKGAGPDADGGQAGRESKGRGGWGGQIQGTSSIALDDRVDETHQRDQEWFAKLLLEAKLVECVHGEKRSC